MNGQTTSITGASVPTQQEIAAKFVGLHVPGQPVVLYNAWDAGSARAVARAGAKAIATGSWSVAAAHGFEDGERIPFDLVLANLRRIVAGVDVPVTLDLETGYGDTAAAVGESVTSVLDAGAIGYNLEDRIIGASQLRSIADQCVRLRAAKDAADRLTIPAYLNARTDIFLANEPSRHGADLLNEALQRAAAYADHGASGLFAPGLVGEDLIGTLCARSPLPVNILTRPNGPSPRRLAELGVARISYGPGPYRIAMQQLEDAAKRALAMRTD